MAQIEFHQVTKRFDDGFEALKDVSVDFPEGSMAFLTGHSGAGKSTFLKLLLCADRPSSGQIIVNGVNVRHIGAGFIFDRVISRFLHHVGAKTATLDHETFNDTMKNKAIVKIVVGIS